MEWLQLPVILLVLTTLIALIEKIIRKKESKKLNWAIIILIFIAFACELRLYYENKKKDNQAALEEKRLNDLNDSLTKVIILKEDGIKEFIETYLLRDSIIKSKYDSINKIVVESDKPIITTADMELIKEGDNKYIYKYSILNVGKRPASNVYGYQYSIYIINNDTINQGFVSLPTGKIPILSPSMQLTINGQLSLKLLNIDIDTNAILYYYILITYNDEIIKSKQYELKVAYRIRIEDLKNDLLIISLCKPWEQNNIEKLLGIK